MSYMSSNPYLLNIVPLFNVADPSNGFIDTTALTALQSMINTTSHTVYADAIEPYTTSGTITVTGTMNVNGTLQVNGYSLGADENGSTTITGCNYNIYSGTTGLTVQSANTSNAPVISFITSTGPALQIDSLGRALYQGDGTTSSINRFWVSSSILSADRAAIGFGSRSTMSTVFDVYKGDAYFDRNVNVNSNVICRALFQFSDERLKQNIASVHGALSTLHMLKGVQYTMDGQPQIGFLAQEVQKVLPEAVCDVKGVLAVDYTRVVPLLLEAIKELDRKLSRLLPSNDC